MHRFSYRAQTASGVVVLGTLRAPSSAQAQQMLTSWGLGVASIKEERARRRTRLLDRLLARVPGGVTGPSAVAFVVAAEGSEDPEEPVGAVVGPAPGPRSRPSSLAERAQSPGMRERPAL